MSDLNPRAALVASATAVALHRGGLSLCGSQIAALAVALERLPRLSVGDRLAVLMGPVGDVISARLDADEFAFDRARDALQRAMCTYWSERMAS